MNPAEIQDLFQLSPFQAQMFSHPQVGFAQREFCLNWPVDLLELARAFGCLVEEQPVLRTRYLIQAGRPVQLVGRKPELSFHCVDLGALAGASRLSPHTVLRRAAQTSVLRRLRAAQVPIQVLVLRTRAGLTLVLSYHAVALDEYSAIALVKRLWQHYAKLRCGSPLEPAQYPGLRPFLKCWPPPRPSRVSASDLPRRCDNTRAHGARALRRRLPKLPEFGLEFPVDQLRASLWGLLFARFTNASCITVQVLSPPAEPRPLGQCLMPRVVSYQLTAQSRFVDLLGHVQARWAEAPAVLAPPPAVILNLAGEQQGPGDVGRSYRDPGQLLQVDWRRDALVLWCAPRFHSPALAQALADDLVQLIEALSKVPHSPLCHLARLRSLAPVLPKLTPVPDPAQRFMAQAEAFPERPAVWHGGQGLSYGDLLARVLSLAQLMRSRISRQPAYPLVALALAEPVGHLQGVLAALCAGLPFLPLDVRQPHAQLLATLGQCPVALVLCDRPLALGLPTLELQVCQAAGTDDYALADLYPDAPAYMIPTSGTTGQPKGVLLRRGGLANTLAWRVDAYAMGAGDRALQVFAPNFDGYLTSALTPLLSGAALVLPENTADPAELQLLLRRERPTHLLITPSHLSALLACLDADNLACVRTLTLAGEKLEAALLAEPALAHMTIVNEYGPTENSIVSTWHRPCRAGDPVPIGRAIDGCAVEIVDRWGNLQLPYAVGELHLSGAGLAFGYHGDPARTAAVFRPHPTSGRCYHSGDLGYLDRMGRLHYLRRRDQQRKLSGYRVEPAELARILERHPEVESARVWVDEDASGPHLVAHYRGAIASARLRDWLVGEAPHWLLPRCLNQV